MSAFGLISTALPSAADILDKAGNVSSFVLPPTPDIREPMSGFRRFMSALPLGADLPGDAPVRLELTLSRHS